MNDIDQAPRPNRGKSSKVQIVYDVLKFTSGMTPHTVASHVYPDGDAEQLIAVRRTLSNGKASGYFVDFMVDDQRYYRLSTRPEYDQRRQENDNRKTLREHQESNKPSLAGFRACMVDFTNKLKRVK